MLSSPIKLKCWYCSAGPPHCQAKLEISLGKYSPPKAKLKCPLKREPEPVESDVMEEYVSLERAREDYGVIINPETLKVDEESTKKLRDSLRKT